MPLFYPVAGQKFYIGGVIADKNTPYVSTDFSSQVWTRVNGWNQMGALGQGAQSIDVPLIDQEWDATLKGSRQPRDWVNRFATQTSDPGQIALIAAELSKSFYAFKVEGNDAVNGTPATVTITVASPGVVSQAAHGKNNDDPVVFSSTGILPGGIIAGTTYYVANKTTGTYELAATPGGASINTTGVQSGVHSASTVGLPSQRLVAGLVMMAEEPNGEANAAQFLEATIRRRMTPVKVPATTPA